MTTPTSIPTFYLGTHHAGWLWRNDVQTPAGQRPPLFVSRRRLTRHKHPKRAQGPWALDSGGFTELTQNGTWTTTAHTYIQEVRRWSDQIGQLQWAAAQDWMVEPHIRKLTGRSLDRHQQHTVTNYLTLKWLDNQLPFIPVLQGHNLPNQHPADSYLRCWDRYHKAGIDLEHQLEGGQIPVVGIGSVCRRQHTNQAHQIVERLAAAGLAGHMHLFGAKTTGLANYGHLISSADSLAWSYTARREQTQLDGCTHTDCRNCIRYALQWHHKVTTTTTNALHNQPTPQPTPQPRPTFPDIGLTPELIRHHHLQPTNPHDSWPQHLSWTRAQHQLGRQLTAYERWKIRTATHLRALDHTSWPQLTEELCNPTQPQHHPPPQQLGLPNTPDGHLQATHWWHSRTQPTTATTHNDTSKITIVDGTTQPPNIPTPANSSRPEPTANQTAA